MPSKKIVLHFKKELVNEPIIYKLVKDHDLILNLLRADIKEGEGLTVLEVTGKANKIQDAVNYLVSKGVKVEPIEKDIIKDDDKCTHCTFCVAHCPTDSLVVKDQKTMEVGFDSSKCIACEECVKVCPVFAMKVKF